MRITSGKANYSIRWILVSLLVVMSRVPLAKAQQGNVCISPPPCVAAPNPEPDPVECSGRGCAVKGDAEYYSPGTTGNLLYACQATPVTCIGGDNEPGTSGYCANTTTDTYPQNGLCGTCPDACNSNCMDGSYNPSQCSCANSNLSLPNGSFFARSILSFEYPALQWLSLSRIQRIRSPLESSPFEKTPLQDN
jgi:hypothetical protein